MIGAVMAGGAGRRMGGAKPSQLLAGHPLIEYPIAALRPICGRVAVLAKSDTELPRVEGAERWDEPDDPLHPLTGLIHALDRAGEAVLVCAADMPFVTQEALRTLLGAATAASGTRAAVAVSAGVVQPLLGIYAPGALPALRAAPDGAPLTESVEALDPMHVALPAAVVRSIDTRDDLEQAERELARA